MSTDKTKETRFGETIFGDDIYVPHDDAMFVFSDGHSERGHAGLRRTHEGWQFILPASPYPDLGKTDQQAPQERGVPGDPDDPPANNEDFRMTNYREQVFDRIEVPNDTPVIEYCVSGGPGTLLSYGTTKALSFDIGSIGDARGVKVFAKATTADCETGR